MCMYGYVYMACLCGYPPTQDCAKFSWTSYQFSAATSAAYQSIYNNTNGINTLDNAHTLVWYVPYKTKYWRGVHFGNWRLLDKISNV